jgi:biotin carboxyl carrier protein
MGIISARYIKAPLLSQLLIAQQLCRQFIHNASIISISSRFLTANLFPSVGFIVQFAIVKLAADMFKATVNKKSFSIEPTDEGFIIDGKEVAWDLKKIEDGYYHILFNNKSFTAELVKADPEVKAFVFKINGRLYNVAVQDRFDLLLEQMGMNAGTSAKVNNIKAPMPGLIIDLKVKSGDAVKPGDTLLILEAMKMENIIKSPGEGVVKSVKISKGQSVEKNQVLIEF